MTTTITSSISSDKSSGTGVPTNGGGIYNSTTTVALPVAKPDDPYKPYMRNLDIDVAAAQLRPRRQVYVYFDEINMAGFWENPNIVTISGGRPQAGSPRFEDVLYKQSEDASIAGGNARILLAEADFVMNRTNVYITAIDGLKSAVTTANTIRGMESGNVGTIIGYEHRSGYIRPGSNNSHIVMALDANSTINNYYVGNNLTIVTGANAGRQGANIISYNAQTRTARVSPAFPYRQANAIYSLGDARKPYSANVWQAAYTTEFGFFAGVLHIPNPANNRVKFLTGDHILTIIDTPQGPESDDYRTKASYKFSAARLDINQTQLNPKSSTAGVGNTFSNSLVGGGSPGNALTYQPIGRPPTGMTLPTRHQPLAQTFRIFPDRWPNGVFLHSIDLFFREKDTVANLPVVVEVRTTVNEIPSTEILPGAVAVVQNDNIITSENPSYRYDPDQAGSPGGAIPKVDPQSNTATRFQFPSPIYLAPATTYAFTVKMPTNFYELYVAEGGQKRWNTNNIMQKLQFYGGGLFKSQNSLLYQIIDNEDMMFGLNFCEFPVNTTGELILSETKMLGAVGSGTVSNTPEIRANSYADSMTIISDTLELPATKARASYRARTDSNNTVDTLYTSFVPEKNINFRERKEIISPDYLPRSLYVKYQLSTVDPMVSPVVYYKRQEAIFHENIINNMPLSNNLINIVDGGASYNGSNTSVVFTSRTGSGANAYVTTNTTTGEIESVIVDQPGSGYFDNVEISLVSSSGSNAVLNVSHELNAFGGPALMRYISKPATLADGFEGGDLRVYLTAIRPATSNIQVYFKVRNSLDEKSLDELSWQKAEQYTSPYTYSTGLKPVELEFRPSNSENALRYESGETTYTTFNQYQIKIVGSSSGTTIYDIPQFLDMRAIALPGDPNLAI